MDFDVLDVADCFSKLLAKYNLPPNLLELEVTESAFVEDEVKIAEQLKKLRKLGLRILIDDFGSGYSSLNALKDISADIIKLDIKFLALNDDNKNKGVEIINSVISMAHHLNMLIIVEGVETHDQARLLLDAGCRYCQGFRFYKPMPSEAFERYFQRFPNIIRKQQHTTAILTGKETTEELRALAQDIYLYFGLAPRSVTKLYVPDGYDFVPLLHILNEESQSIADHNQYLNNLDYQKAIRLMSSKYYMDAGTFLFEENDGFDTPISVLYYTYYHSMPALPDNALQIVERANGKHPFGQAHYPSLLDYPNDMDVMQFLGRL